jgi:hypothetical protein
MAESNRRSKWFTWVGLVNWIEMLLLHGLKIPFFEPEILSRSRCVDGGRGAFGGRNFCEDKTLIGMGRRFSDDILSSIELGEDLWGDSFVWWHISNLNEERWVIFDGIPWNYRSISPLLSRKRQAGQ